jgi:hypothetical protein
MKKIIRLTESDLTRIVKRVINERENNENPEWLKTLRTISKFFLESQNGEVKISGIYYNERDNHLVISVESGGMTTRPHYGPLVSKEIDDMMTEVSDEYNIEFKLIRTNLEDFDNAHTKQSSRDFAQDNYNIIFEFRVIEL